MEVKKKIINKKYYRKLPSWEFFGYNLSIIVNLYLIVKEERNKYG